MLSGLSLCDPMDLPVFLSDEGVELPWYRTCWRIIDINNGVLDRAALC